mgnify:CR=1 FL=1
MRKIHKFLLSGLSLFCVGITTINSNKIDSVFATDEALPVIETTLPFDDLKNDDTFYGKYCSNQYGYGKGSTCEMLTILEYAYDTQYKWDYGLYVYIYNPITDDVDYTSLKNRIVIETSDKDENVTLPYQYYNMTYISKSDVNGHYVFLKYRVDVDENFYNSLSSEKRIYSISKFDLLISGNNNATSFTVGHSYIFSGFAKGIKENFNTLTCQKMDVLELQLNGGTKRSGAINSSGTLQTDLHYAYFSIPNSLEREYGNLYSAKYTGYKYEMTQPFYVWDLSKSDFSPNADTCHTFKFYDPKHFDNLADTQQVLLEPYVLAGYMDSNGNTISNDEYNFQYEISSAFTNTLPTERLFYTNNSELTIPKSTLENRVRNNWSKYNYIKTDISNVLSVDDYQLSTGSAPTPNSSFLTRFFNFFMDGDTGCGEVLDDGVYWENLSALTKITSKENDNDGNTYFIDKDDVEEFNTAYKNAQDEDKSLYLLRFDTSEYWSAKIAEQRTSFWLWSNDAQIRGYSCYFSFIDEFTILTLTFKSKDTLIEIPVCASPISIFPNLTAPPTTPPEKDYTWLYIILGIVGGCFIISFGSKIYTFVTDAKSKKMSYKMNKLSFKEKKSILKKKKRKD